MRWEWRCICEPMDAVVTGKMRIIRLPGLTAYKEGWDVQEQVHAEVAAGGAEAVILCEHKSVVTIGRSGGDDHLLTSPERLLEMGYELAYTNRGGDITYHGPGQLVIYPIFDLKRRGLDLHRFLRHLEELGILLCAHYGIRGFRVAGRTGVWTAKGKIAAIGIHVKKWVTMHGMAFNVTKHSLEGFKHIVPCGIQDGGVACLEDWGEARSVEKVGRLVEEASLSIIYYKSVKKEC